MPTIYSQTFEGSSSLPSGWNFDSGFAVDTTSKLVGTNSLAITATGVKSAFYATPDGVGGNAQAQARLKVASPGTSSKISLVARLSSPVIANFATSATSYRAEMTLGTSNTADWKIYERTGSTETALVTGAAGLRTALAADTAYEAWFVPVSSAASVNVRLSLFVIRVSDGLFLTTTGTWQATEASCLSVVDSATPFAGSTCSGLQVDLASGATAYFDEFAIVDYVDNSNYLTSWADDSGWTPGIATVSANYFGAGVNAAVVSQATSGGSLKTCSTGFTDRRWNSSATWRALIKMSTLNAGALYRFGVRGYNLQIDTGLSTISLVGGTTTPTITYTAANWNVTKTYRVVVYGKDATIRYRVIDEATGNYLQTNGTFASTPVWCFDYTNATAPNPSIGISFGNGSTIAADLAVGPITAGPAGTPIATPNPASVPLGGSLVITPSFFSGVSTTAAAGAGSYNTTTGAYTAPASGTSDTLTFTGTYVPSESVAVPITLTSAAATSYTLTAPSPASGLTGVASGNFTLTPDGPSSAVVTITPSGGGLSTPFTVTFDGTAAAKTFTITPSSAGTVTLTPTNGGGLTNPSAVTYAASAPLATAYVASNGSDSTTNGGSSGAPFLTIAAARAAMVASGGALNLRGGDTFPGGLVFTAPVTIQSYGTGKATLTAAGNVLRFNDCDGITVDNLILTNTTTSNPVVFFNNTDAVRRTGGVTVSNCTISGGSRGIFLSAATATAGGWNGVTITDNEVSNVVAIGIDTGDSAAAGTNKHYSDVLVQDNVIHEITASAGSGAHGIVLSNCDSVTGTGAAQCVVRGNHIYNLNLGGLSNEVGGPGGIFPKQSDGILIEGNLIHDVVSGLGGDGVGIDADTDATNCIFQRNFVYDTGGAGMLFYACGAGNVCRFNVFLNTGTAGLDRNAGIRLHTNQAQVVHSNIVYNSAALASALTSVGGSSFGKKVYDNIFVSADGVPAIDIEVGTTTDLQGNAYQSGSGVSFKANGTTYSSLAAFRAAFASSPALESSGHGFVTTSPFIGYGTAIPTPTDASTMLGTIGDYFDHPPGSALSLAGLNLQAAFGIDPGTLDFKGSAIPTPYSVGAIATAAAPATATTYTLTGPSSGAVGAASTSFTVTPNAPFTGTVAPSSGGGGGTFSPASLTWSGTSDAKTFTYTPATAGAKTISTSDDGGLADPSPITYTATAVATSYTATGPTTGQAGASTGNFAVTPNAPYTGTITGTPSGPASTGLSPVVLTFSGSAAPQDASWTPTVAGTLTITWTNSGSLTNPSASTYTATASGGGNPVTDQEIAAIAAEVVAQLNANAAGIPAKVVAIVDSTTAALSLKADCLAIPAEAYQAIAEIVAPMVAEIIGSIRLNSGTVLASPDPTTTTFSATIVDADGDPVTTGSNAFRGQPLILQGDVNSKRTITSHQVVGSTHRFAIDSANPLAVAPAAGTTFKIG